MEKMKIMLVDDEERFLLTTGKLLARKGFDILTASRGEQCLEMLADNLVHVVILDVKMPGMSGLETLQEIKRDHPLIEVIMLTGHATVESAVEGLRSGAIDYLMKPVSVDDLMAKAEAAFARRQIIEDKIRSARTRKSMDQPTDDALNEAVKKE
ncbi:MAG: response regulator [Desulfobacteraceae bacterium]|jgi:DNA-binding NtrC family response regulator|nr:MAG: response regulator [Desulfobacteraceae bacterium]